MRRLTKVSKFLSFVLRHNPASIGIALDPSGWARIDELIEGASRSGIVLDRDTLGRIVESDPKRRYALSADGLCIRANYGHSVPVDLGLRPLAPPEHLFHGTAKRNLDAIRVGGLQPGRRQFVHLSKDAATAVNVGRRHGSPVVLRVKAHDMHVQGHRFFESRSEIWLTRYVPPDYIIFPQSTGRDVG